LGYVVDFVNKEFQILEQGQKTENKDGEKSCDN